MAYTAPSAVTTGQSITATLYNTFVKDNILDHESRIVTAGPAGVVSAFAGTAAPTGWLLCDGSQVSQATYAALYAVVGANAFGTDSGGNFFLPDLQGRVAIGLGTNGDVNAVGDNEGITLANVANRSPKHKHSNNLTVNSGGVDHYHGYDRPYYDVIENSGTGATSYTTPQISRGFGGSKAVNTGNASAYNHAHSMSGSVGVGSGIDNTMPYLTLNYIIKF